MTEQKRLELLIKYHGNLTAQLGKFSFTSGGERLSAQIVKVENAIEFLLFKESEVPKCTSPIST